MKYLFWFALLSSSTFAQNLSPEEQRILLNDVKELKAKVQKLESGKTQKGLKTVDYAGGTTETASGPASPATPSLTPEQTRLLMETLTKAKGHQAEQEKALKELENEE